MNRFGQSRFVAKGSSPFRERRLAGRVRTRGLISFRAFTLLELMLALALTAVVLIAVNMAVNLHLRLFDSRRTYLEESQLAREVLRLMSDDLRSAVTPYEQDVSCVTEMLSTASSPTSSGSSSSGGSSASGSSSGGSQSSGSPSSGGSPAGGSSPPGGRGETGAGSPTGDSSGADGSSELSADTAEMLGESDASVNTQDLATSVTVPTKPGIYGNQYELQVDISRLPREDEFIADVESNPTTEIIDIPSDVKTVTYYVLSSATSLTGSQPAVTVADLSQADDPAVVGHGLVRRQLDRCVTEWALNSGNATMLANEGEVIAPEAISVEFLYFDGLEWRTEWDSEAEGGIPIAIQIVLAFGDASAIAATPLASTSVPATGLENIRYYRTIVHLPTATALEEELTSDTESLAL
jgi:prepilin-type N-terminal cleavage/methylation domain-containing protein